MTVAILGTAWQTKLLNLLRKSGTTNDVASVNPYLALHLADKLQATVLAAVTAITMSKKPPVGSVIIIDVLGGSPETRTVTSVTGGASPYTVNFSGGLSNGHNINCYVQYDPDRTTLTGDSALNEPVGNGYARMQVDGSTNTFTAPADDTTSHQRQEMHNGQAWTLGPNTTADWGLVTHAALVDSASGAIAQIYGIGALAAAQLVQVNGSFKFAAAGDFKVQLGLE